MTRSDTPPPLDILGTDLVDLRATVESMNRCVIKSQSNIDQYRHTTERKALETIASCLDQLEKEARIVLESVVRTRLSLASVTAA